MALNVYSVLMFQEHDLSGDSVVLTPPAGKLWVVRDIDVVNGELLNNILFFGALDQVIWAHSFGGTIAFDYASFRGRQVIQPGGTCRFHSTAALDVTMSGYELSLP